MADTKLSALTQLVTPTDADEIYVNDGGASKRITMSDLLAYIESRTTLYNASTADQTLGTGDTYVTNSNITIPTGRAQAKTGYRCRFNITKTAAGTATPQVNVRVGTAGSTADGARGQLNFPAQTGVIDEGMIEVFSTFRTAGASAQMINIGVLQHRLTSTGLGTTVVEVVNSFGGTFDVTGAGNIVGLSVNAGASSAWTLRLVQAELFNLA